MTLGEGRDWFPAVVDTRDVVACSYCQWAVRRLRYQDKVNAKAQHEAEYPGHKAQILSASEVRP